MFGELLLQVSVFTSTLYHTVLKTVTNSFSRRWGLCYGDLILQYLPCSIRKDASLSRFAGAALGHRAIFIIC